MKDFFRLSEGKDYIFKSLLKEYLNDKKQKINLFMEEEKNAIFAFVMLLSNCQIIDYDYNFFEKDLNSMNEYIEKIDNFFTLLKEIINILDNKMKYYAIIAKNILFYEKKLGEEIIDLKKQFILNLNNEFYITIKKNEKEYNLLFNLLKKEKTILRLNEILEEV